MSPLELVDDRFEKLAQELRAARPVAPDALRERVRALTPPPPRRFEPNLRRLVPVAGFAGLAAALGVAVVFGIVHGSSVPRPSPRAASAPRVVPHGGVFEKTPKATAYGRFRFEALTPSRVRLQQYDAFLRVRVRDQDELSKRTQDALRFTRSVGGYVVWARYAAPGKRGDSELALRVPIEHVQAAIAHFAGYGTLVRQRIVLKDLQQRVDALSARIAKLRAEIARLERQGGPQKLIARDKALLAKLTSGRAAAVRHAQFASVALTMVVGEKATAAPGRFRRTLDDAASVLVRELEILLYALLVAGPLLLLGAAGIVGARTLRRRADQRLLERT